MNCQMETKNKIEDIEEFTKLFKINIPVEKEFEYYIETLNKSEEYSYGGPLVLLNDTIESFNKLEEYVVEQGYASIKAYKNYCMDALANYIKSTNAYNNLISAEMPSIKMFTKDHTNQMEESHYLISLDFRSANYSVLKTFQNDGENELCESWKKLCEKFNIHETLANSKSFRQIVFGNTNPKRLQTFQHEKIIKLVGFLQDKLSFKEEDFVFISHDELIFKVRKANTVVAIEDLHMKTMEKLTNMSIKLTAFSMRKIKKNIFVKTLYRISPGFNDITNYYFSEFYNTLHGVPGNKFYMYFKKYILKEPLDERDLLHYNDGELCKWVDEDTKAKKKVLPHYDKLSCIVSTKEAREDYSYLWSGLESVLPDMSNEEKRRVIEVVVNTCKHCFQAPSGCRCWDDQ